MTKKNVLENKLFRYIVCALLITMLGYALFLIVGNFSKADLDVEKWDGESISSSFSSGNGSLENPFIINNGADLNYFRSLMNDSTYNSLNYKLGNDINLDNHLFETIDTFKGTLDGDGYTIYNALFSGLEKEDNIYYGLFSTIDGGTIKNLNINKSSIVLLNTEKKYTIGTLSGKVINSNIYNVTVSEGNIDVTKSNNQNNIVAGFIGEVTTGNDIHNIYLDTNINTNNDNVGKIFYTLDSDVNDLISVVNVYGNNSEINNFVNSSNDSKINNLVIGEKGNSITFNTDIINVLNNYNDGIEDYYFEYNDDKVVFKKIALTATVNPDVPLPFAFGRAADIPLHESGIDTSTSTIYINDLESDYNYYMGLNYTQTNDGKVPNGNNYGYYNDSNLAKIYIKYSGTDIAGNYTGYVSNTERISDYIYYKYYYVTNNQVTIELIDHPYADRPTDKVFHGWITDDPNVNIWYDKDVHIYYATIPIASVEEVTSVTFYAQWVGGFIEQITSTTAGNTNGINTCISRLQAGGITKLGRTINYEDVRAYYTRKTANRNTNYPNGAVNQNGTALSGRCTTRGGCTYYIHPTSADYVNNETYYNLVNGTMTTVTIRSYYGGDGSLRSIENGTVAAGFYRQVTVARNSSLVGYYNTSGVYQNSGTCTTTNGCTMYERIPYYDENGNVNLVTDDNDNYYYYVTRDTNILVYRANITTRVNSSKPMTITTLNNGTSGTYQLNISNTYVSLAADMRIEHIVLRTNASATTGNPTSGKTTGDMVYGNYYNLKIGRGITMYNNYVAAAAVLGGSQGGTGSGNAVTKYRLIIESGYYSNLSLTNGASASGTLYVNAHGVYGCDYDRISGNNTNLRVYDTAAGAWSGNIRGASDIDVALFTNVKSGTIGTSKGDYTTGIYIGGLNGGTHYAARGALIEGGYVYNLLGGPLSSDGREGYNDIYANVKGGSVDYIVGGAGRTETYGNRIITVTGGTINYAIFGGSNGVSGSNSSSSRGTLTGDSFVYVGGNALVGSDAAINGNSPEYGEEIGSVFGIGNGNSRYDMIGTAKNSTVIIDGNAHIRKSVYGGGNYGAVGTETSASTASTVIKILGGTIDGSVFGGGNRNGAGTSSKKATINIEMLGGTVNGSVYGGANIRGVVYGNTNVNIYGGTINTDVYGGGEGNYTNTTNYGTAVMENVNVVIGRPTGEQLPLTINGSVYGGSALGSVNGNNRNTTYRDYDTNVTVHYGIINKSVFGGGKGTSSITPYVQGDVTVNVNGGNISSLYGGNDASGQPNGTVVVYLNGGIIGDAFGGGNSTGQRNTNINLQGAQVTNLFGGSNVTGTVPNSLVNVTSGQVANVFGGNNVGGTVGTSVVNYSGATITGDIYGGGKMADITGSSTVTISNATVNDVYGGGMQASCPTTTITSTNVTGKNIFGGSNVTGTVNTSTLNINGIKYDAIYGGNNQGGTTTTTNLNINSGTIGAVIGGGNKAESGVSNIAINNGTITDVYGGGNEAGLTTSNVVIYGGTVTNVYGGSNKSGDLTTANVTVGETVQTDNPLQVTLTATPEQSTWQSNVYATYSKIRVKIVNASDQTVNIWRVQLTLPEDTVIYANYSGTVFDIINGIMEFNQVNKWDANRPNSLAPGASFEFEFEVLTNTLVADFFVNSKILEPAGSGNSEIPENNINVSNVYGGNNQGGTTRATNVDVNYGILNNLYGGGNLAPVGSTHVVVSNATVLNIYGGGNLAQVNNSTYLDINNCKLNASVYGGGNEGPVLGSTEVYVSDSTVLGSLYAGGNGASAIVSGNTSVTIDGLTNIGNESSVAPFAGCVFGSGNAAATGLDSTRNSTATVNIVGGHIYENVYGGANTSIVYGATYTNIGSKAVNMTGLKVNDLIIDGTVFGGGESNAEGKEEYDFDFKSVIGSIDINIDGTGYIPSKLSFQLTGSIFGSGNASSSEGTSRITVKKLGEKDKPSRNLSFQRTDILTIDNSYMELVGIEDRTNEYSDILYSFNQINSLIIKNDTTLLLQRNANMLKELYSGVDVNGNLVPATVTINDDTKTVTKNVDNRIYMIPNRSLNVTTNQAATAYGKVTGMTFFGMYNTYSSGSYAYGMYGSGYTYGTAANMSDAIIGGSYVLGLHALEHDITKDGFYTNVLNDAENEIITEYIDPTPKDTNFYRWVVGMNAINYTVNLTSTKYSSLGTYTLSLLDFTKGNTIFNVMGFNCEGLASGVTLVNPVDVPRVTDTPEQANQILGLAMKSETREWTSYGVTQFLSEDNGSVIGTDQYLTDSQTIAPSLMFYLYHAKNVLLSQSLGTVVITLQALQPVSPIEYEIKYITITVDMEARNYDDGNSYDAAITYDKKYDLPSITDVKITNRSQFTAYYSLFAIGESFDKFYGQGNSNTHVLVSDFALPIGTQITMIDYGYDYENPKYYYFNVTQDVYNNSVQELEEENEVTYRLSDFIKMGSTSPTNTYNDQDANLKYYSTNNNCAMEEFIFIFDFKDTSITGQHLNNSILIELRNNEDRGLISVLGIRQTIMKYSLYDESNSVLVQTYNGLDDYLYNGISEEFTLSTNIDYDQTENREAIIDTNYEANCMGLNISLFDSQGIQISSSMLQGTVITVGDKPYLVDGDGIFRIKLAGKVSNLNRNLSITIDNGVPPGIYTINFTLFASPDGLHNSSTNKYVEYKKQITVVDDDNALVVTTDDTTKLVDGETGKNKNNTIFNQYTITNKSVLLNPNIRVDLFKRSIVNANTLDYVEVPFNTLFSDSVTSSNNSLYPYEIRLNSTANSTTIYTFYLNENITSGTYKLVFRLYDNNQVVDEEIQYVIVTKKIENE